MHTGAFEQAAILWKKKELVETQRKELVGRKLQLVGGKDDILDSESVIGKWRENSGGEPIPLSKLLNQNAIARRRSERFVELVSKTGGGILGRCGLALHGKEIFGGFQGKTEKLQCVLGGGSGIRCMVWT